MLPEEEAPDKNKWNPVTNWVLFTLTSVSYGCSLTLLPPASQPPWLSTCSLIDVPPVDHNTHFSFPHLSPALSHLWFISSSNSWSSHNTPFLWDITSFLVEVWGAWKTGCWPACRFGGAPRRNWLEDGEDLGEEGARGIADSRKGTARSGTCEYLCKIMGESGLSVSRLLKMDVHIFLFPQQDCYSQRQR